MKNTVSWFRRIAVWEGISYLLLVFIAMPLKYWMDAPAMVTHVGRVHGGLFVLYVALLVLCQVERKWPLKRAGMYFLASLLPFATFWVEKDAQRPE